MNWVISKAFDDNGNAISEGKKFYDNNGQLLQSQSKTFYRADANTVFTHVLASQSMADAYGRYVATSMSAPIDYADFSYRPNFILAPDGSNYTYKNFDRYNPISGSPTDKTDGSPSIPNSGPDPIGGQSTRGTLGWYFSTSNYWEPYTPTSTYPYSRQTFYRDGTGNVKKQGGEGETFKLASTHEASSYIVPVSGELQNYLAVRNQVFPSSQMGTMASSLLNNASMTISRDANGQEVVSISDRAGNVLMTARPGTGLIASNTASIVAIPTGYTQQVTCVTGTNVQLQTLTGGNNLVIYGVGASGTISSIYSGAATGAPLTIMGNGSFILLSDLPFSITYLSSAVSYSTGSEAYAGSRLPSFSYFRILADNTPVTITGSFSLEDMNSETFTSLPGGTTLNRGYYKITAITGIVNLSYNNGFMDVSYGFYDQKGQLVATVPPNGTKQLFGTGYMAFSTPASIPFVSLFSYDSQGRIIGNTTPDGGTSNMIYRLDGKIRFSQNALQTATGSFSYTDFDALGRPVESGQYRPLTGGVTYNGPAMTGLLGYTGINGSNDGLTNGVKTDVIMTTYDVPDNTHNQPGYAQVEANLGGAVSTSKKYRTITNNTPLTTDLVSQTWYNYDEEGRVVWTIKYIADLGSAGYKTTENTYDALGRLTKKIYQRCTGCNDMFVHYFQYDPANGNLWKVYTATADVGIPPTGSATLQATYIYYLNGGLKRVELGTNLQGIDYVYTLRGDLKSINNSNAGASADPGGDATTSNGFQPDVFGEVLDYFPNDYANGRSGIASINGVNTSAIVPTESYAGNIKAMTWYSTKPPGLGGSNSPTTYVFNYDPKYQFIAGTYGTGLNFGAAPATFTATSRNKETVVVPGSGTPGIPAYDNNGNILNLQRTDDGGVTTDQLAYSYTANTNKLATVTNTGSLGGAYSYSYDALGRQTSETNGAAPAKYIRYDIYGRPTLVALDAGFIHPLVGFVYDETGRRIEKIVYTADQISMITYYYSEAIYTQTVTNGVYGTLTPREFEVPGAQGRLGIYKPGGTYLYEITDHLGTVRAILTSSGSTQTTSEYYPFGLAFGGMGPGYRYGYQGQSSEADGETGWNSFNLRMYNPRIARWLTTDPKGQYFSTYEGMGNDPVKNKDADGGSTDDGGDFSEDFDMFDGGEAWNDIVLQDKAGNVLFVLKDNKNPCILQWEGTADLYKQAIQWFEPLADNYMPVAWLNPEIGKISTLKHFSWDDVAKFAEVNRSMWNYKQGWSGDWKKVQADGYYMSTIDGYPYWSDAIGQIPFAVDYFTDVFKGNSNDAIAETIEKGRAHGDGGAIFATAENGNIYDIYFVLRGALYASHRYTVTLEKTLLGPSWVLHPQPYAPSNMGSPISPGQAQMFLK
ncbi:MAG TPA: RHS repeat-associated core domain-containing protein, partial [Puia sp.]